MQRKGYKVLSLYPDFRFPGENFAAEVTKMTYKASNGIIIFCGKEAPSFAGSHYLSLYATGRDRFVLI